MIDEEVIPGDVEDPAEDGAEVAGAEEELEGFGEEPEEQPARTTADATITLASEYFPLLLTSVFAHAFRECPTSPPVRP